MKNKQIGGRYVVSVLICVLLFAAAAVGAFGQKAQEKPLPNLSLSEINGRQWSLEDDRGKVVLLNFWATWCAPCRSEVPVLVSLSDKYKTDGLKIVGVSVDSENADAINEFIKDFKIDYTVVLAVPGSLLSRQKAIPMSLLIDEKGVLAKKYVGAIEKSVLEKDIRVLLGKNDAAQRKTPAGKKKTASGRASEKAKN